MMLVHKHGTKQNTKKWKTMFLLFSLKTHCENNCFVK